MTIENLRAFTMASAPQGGSHDLQIETVSVLGQPAFTIRGNRLHSEMPDLTESAPYYSVITCNDETISTVEIGEVVAGQLDQRIRIYYPEDSERSNFVELSMMDLVDATEDAQMEAIEALVAKAVDNINNNLDVDFEAIKTELTEEIGAKPAQAYVTTPLPPSNDGR